ncbi:MAG: spoIIIJ-associated protein [Candidatus Saccharibacteria bacterium GW2011_GWC2_48_9]|nr:MAG: spoIIIJ-associated protein [Candidatus Saccharibacteria bacterium GW2011_GWC2_48_9]HCH34598.1 single-stranded DNA-binding protein [Candidatus Saccharibacteria bacterium]
MNQQASIDLAAKTVQDLISFFEINIDVETTFEDGVINVSVASSELNSLLIGRNAETLRSMQSIVSSVLRNSGAELQRVNIDIADYKKQRAEKLAEKARGWIEEVRRTGDSYVADLNAADRRVVHHVASEYSDIHTFSEGEGRDRRLIIAQASS